MKKLFFAISVFLFLSSVMVIGQTANNTKYLDYPIEYSQLAGTFVAKPTPRILFSTNYLLNTKNDQDKIVKCKVNKKTVEGNIITYLLSVNVDGSPVILITIKLEANDDEACNYMTYFKMKNVASGAITEMESDGTPESYGNVIGGFIGLSNYMFNVEKINSKLSEKKE